MMELEARNRECQQYSDARVSYYIFAFPPAALSTPPEVFFEMHLKLGTYGRARGVEQGMNASSIYSDARVSYSIFFFPPVAMPTPPEVFFKIHLHFPIDIVQPETSLGSSLVIARTLRLTYPRPC